LVESAGAKHLGRNGLSLHRRLRGNPMAGREKLLENWKQPLFASFSDHVGVAGFKMGVRCDQ
jgi:hypothetical protein